MTEHRCAPLVLRLDHPDADLSRVGGKGASLARLAVAGLPVPGGFHVTTEAYGCFVESAGIGEEIRRAAGAADAGRPETLDAAERDIRALFGGAEIPEETAAQIRTAYAGLGGAPVPVAVRSSATAEDLPELSFAGQQETYLNIRGERSLLNAVRDCWASLWTARAIGYRARNGIASADVRLAVVVQELIPADAAGVLFTADPTTGDRGRIVVNAAWGLGESVVGGQVTPDTVVVDRGSGTVLEEHIGHKTVRTVRTPEGTAEEPVPGELRDRAVLDTAQAEELARLGVRIEELYGTPMDIEWARREGRLHILQARPVTTLPAGGGAPEREVWNDSLDGDYLWTGTNVGEALPGTMTPATWSLIRPLLEQASPTQAAFPGVPPFGHIGGRLYLNVSTSALFGDSRLTKGIIEEAVGKLPAGTEIPPLPFSRLRILGHLIRVVIRSIRGHRHLLKDLDERLARFPELHRRVRAAIRAADDPAALAHAWDAEVEPAVRLATRLFYASRFRAGTAMVAFRPWLRKHGTSEADMNALATQIADHGSADPMASLGPVVGLAQLARGEIDRETFASRWGHRCPGELELSAPRPAEDPDWIDRQAQNMREAPMDVAALLERQRREHDAAWARFAERHPGKTGKLRRRMAKTTAAFRIREAGRSEFVRGVGLLRAFIVRAGELTGHGDDLFFLSIGEILAVLRGDPAPAAKIPVRRATYEHYRSLPPYPILIRGRFHPERWAADPRRRTDIFDESRDLPPAGDAISGTPGAAGIVAGPARVVFSAEEGEALRPGEILVTAVTNVGWTPLFPRAAAVVTDIGASLSHAAIVARELGIPAVVGCGTATARISTGDLVRVDGGEGTVEVVQAGADAAQAAERTG